MTEMYSGLHVGQRFNSLEDFKTFIRGTSVRQHWDLRVVRSNKKSVVLGCRSSSSCYFRVVCRANKHATYITSLQDTHSCRRNPTTSESAPARSEASHVRFLLNEIPKLFDMKNRVKGQEVVEAVERYHGYRISMRQAQRALTKLQPRQSQAHPDDNADGESNTSQAPAPPGPVRPGGPAFDNLTENRWDENELQSTLIEDEGMDQDDSPDTPVPPQPHIPPVSSMAHHHQPPPVEQRPIAHHPPQINILPPPPQPFAQPPQQNQIPPPRATPKPPGPQLPQTHPPPPQAGHSSAAQLVLTNFKIEFTCTTCGALNQSFFPNQGNITGNNYIPHSLPHSNNSRSQPIGAVGHEGPGSSGGNGYDEDEYEGNTAGHGRNIQPPWAGALDVPITSAHT